MGIRVIVREGESIEQALKQLRALILEHQRWPVYSLHTHKRNPAYYERPSVLRRRWRRVQKYNRRGRRLRGFWYDGHGSVRAYEDFPP